MPTRSSLTIDRAGSSCHFIETKGQKNRFAFAPSAVKSGNWGQRASALSESAGVCCACATAAAPCGHGPKGKLSGSVTPAIRSNFGETCSSASKLALVEPCEPCGRRRWPAARAAGRCAWRCGGAGYARTHGGPWRSVRCAATARDPTPPRRSPSRHGGRASSLRTAISQRYRSTDVTSGHGAPASATMIAPAAFHDPVAARVAAAARLG